MRYSAASRRFWCESGRGDVQVREGRDVLKLRTTSRGIRQTRESRRRCDAKMLTRIALRCRWSVVDQKSWT